MRPSVWAAAEIPLPYCLLSYRGGHYVRPRSVKRPCSAERDCAASGPTVRIRITAPQSMHRAFQELLRRILLQYVPAGMTIPVRWIAAEVASGDVIGENGFVLDEEPTGTLGQNSAIGHSRIGGRDRGRIGETGYSMGRLQ